MKWNSPLGGLVTFVGLFSALVATDFATNFAVSGTRAPNVTRDSYGRIERSEAQRDAFKRANSCPSTGKSSGPCPGYIIDHVIPLCKGGPDLPANMKYQTTADAKAKNKVECK